MVEVEKAAAGLAMAAAATVAGADSAEEATEAASSAEAVAPVASQRGPPEGGTAALVVAWVTP